MNRYMDDTDFNALNNHLVDVNGNEYSAKDYLVKFDEGMNKQIDRKMFPRSYEFPTGVQFELTYKCNHRCIHCYNQSGGNHEEKEMTLEQWKKLSHRLGELGIFQCVISGGEPTLLKESLFEIMDILDNYSVKFIFISNGLILNKEYVKKLSKYKYTWFQISIDGSRPELHNYVRGLDSWNQAINAANLIKRAGLPLVISHAVVKKNYDYLEEMIDMSYLLGARRIITGPFSYSGRALINGKELELSTDEKENVYEIVAKKSKEYKGRMEVIASAEEVIGLRIKQKDVNGVILIRPNGDVKIDCVAPFKIGNVLEEDIYSIWNRIGRNVWEHPRVVEYINSIHSSDDLRCVYPRINVDPDELLVNI
ncbi:radical SAM protein [Clostridium cadaveris]|uniref:Radical SAM superfamily enzyme, MoaA/NifB/PqqE/SkfB family n=1 Tax=Clostridium cadaveris TaxID=1529 RepID=A0A1I2JU51_9CLOT|nr:radical SAM protein [Clostridium cadaveris]SFF57440.1 Radical SAM superfamily enzyme, MoaA/NifB/PqqE/SkfB family [Clostridium cadaveris]